MAEIIIPTRLTADATQRGHLQTLFASPGFSLLKEMVAARCIEAQVESMKLRLYPEYGTAKAGADENETKAITLNNCLDLLDELSGNDQEWYTVKLEHRR